MTTTYDVAERATAVSGNYAGQQTNYVSNLQYAPQGVPTQYAYANQLIRQLGYNNRLQLTGYTDTNNSTGSQLLTATLNWVHNQQRQSAKR